MESQTADEVAAPNVSPWVVGTMAFATGAVIANLYYAQPLVDTLARVFQADSDAIGLTITVTQIGYALGLALLVPLGDLIERRKLLAALLAAATLGMAAMALAPSLIVFGAAAAVVGLTSVAVQVIVPFAHVLAAKGQQGRVVSTVMSGLLMGILLSRTVAGLVAEAFGWQAVFGLGAVLTALIAVVLWRALPTVAPTVTMRYPALLGSVLRLVREEPVLRLRMLYGALTFSTFSVFWTSAGFLLAGDPYNWNEAQIGLFALFGVAGALAAKFAGGLADRGWVHLTTGAYLLITALSYLLIGWGAVSVVALAIGVLLMDMGVQGTHINNQSLIFALRPDARSRLNTAYMVSYFISAAVGSALSAVVYVAYDWIGVAVLGGLFPALACVVWAVEHFSRSRREAAAATGS
ncbi:MFS transporter [Allonocardiopsis opalescens]|uniref:Putative MFS family arabinose efflux permease n=1 Tax=Allonocardiopsis opalescens TaxID=1144618 RepID=A0A2T0QAZ5_9ACTN|nr:MFS transporter [Allonocardiopsis opalescens]PRY01017.1 putative MFS family arabinose efflux permease [Allonocardiopsis opalescens]